jgi:hypothetical protein
MRLSQCEPMRDSRSASGLAGNAVLTRAGRWGGGAVGAGRSGMTSGLGGFGGDGGGTAATPTGACTAGSGSIRSFCSIRYTRVVSSARIRLMASRSLCDASMGRASNYARKTGSVHVISHADQRVDSEFRVTAGSRMHSLQPSVANGAWGMRSGFLALAPRADIHCVESNAEQVCRNEAELRSPEADQANHHAIDCRQNPAFPAALSYQDGRNDRKHAR